MEEGRKKCPRCQEWKALGEFNRNKSRADGLQDQCRRCQRIAVAASYERRKNGTQRATKKRPANIDSGSDWCSYSDHVVSVSDMTLNKNRATGRAHFCNECSVVHYYKSTYGISKSEFDAKLASQNGQCAICETFEPSKGWAMDHWHGCCPKKKTCGLCLRSVLCHNCNVMLGLFAEDIPTIEEAASYLCRGYAEIPDLDAYVPWGSTTQRDGKLWNRYRIREVHFDYLADRYNGCFIHGGLECANGKSLVVDHDDSHCRGKRQGCQECIRGLICDATNAAMGYANHDPAVLRSAINYLEKWNGILAEKKSNLALVS